MSVDICLLPCTNLCPILEAATSHPSHPTLRVALSRGQCRKPTRHTAVRAVLGGCHLQALGLLAAVCGWAGARWALQRMVEQEEGAEEEEAEKEEAERKSKKSQPKERGCLVLLCFY